MDILEEKSDKSLSFFIPRYLYLEATTNEMPEARVLPTGHSYLTYVHGRPSLVRINGSERELPRLFLGGQVTTADIVLLPQEKICHTGVEFHPAAMHLMFGIDMSSSTNNYLDFYGLWKEPELLKELTTIFKSEESFEARCRMLDDFFKKIKPEIGMLPPVVKAVKSILENDGLLTISSLAAEVGLSERQMRRQFKLMCGISPQKYAKIVQIKSVFRQIENQDTYKLRELAYDCSFFDVSHFINSFKKHIGQNPRSFLDSKDEFIRVYLKNS